MIAIREAHIEHVPLIREIALPTWRDTYSAILSQEQLEFMLAKIYAPERIAEEIASGKQQYLILYAEEVPMGFAAYAERPEQRGVYKLHKIYCLPETKGKGYGKALLEEVEQRVRQTGSRVFELNVNKYNPAKGFYEKMGFEVAYEEDIPIGAYWMNDYVMRKIL